MKPVPTCLAVTSAAHPGSILLATASSQSEVLIYKVSYECHEPAWTESDAKVGSSSRLSTYKVSAMTFHPTRAEVLVATMDGSIHFLSTTDATCCTSMACIQLPKLLISALKAQAVVHHPAQIAHCALTKARVCSHAAKARAASVDAMSKAAAKHTSAQHTAAGSQEDYDSVESIQSILSLCFVPLHQPQQSVSTGSGQTSDCPGPDDSSARGSFEHNSRSAALRHVQVIIRLQLSQG